MARRLFPDEGSALVTTSSGYGTPLLSGQGIQFEVFEDASGVHLADIRHPSGEVIANSIITVDANSLLPNFLGPDNVSQLWVRQLGQSGLEPVFATVPGSTTVVIPVGVASASWTLVHQQHAFPSVTIVNSAGEEVIGEVQYDSDVQVTVRFSQPFSGTAYLNC